MLTLVPPRQLLIWLDHLLTPVRWFVPVLQQLSLLLYRLDWWILPVEDPTFSIRDDIEQEMDVSHSTLRDTFFSGWTGPPLSLS